MAVFNDPNKKKILLQSRQAKLFAELVKKTKMMHLASLNRPKATFDSNPNISRSWLKCKRKLGAGAVIDW